MVRSATAVTAAIFVLVPVIGFTQQEASGPSRIESPAPRSSPESTAVREGVAAALDGAVTFQKAIPDPPEGTWGIIAEGTGGGGIFRDSGTEAEAWLGTGRAGVVGYGNFAGGHFVDIDDFAYAYVGSGTWGIYAGGSAAGGYFEDTDTSSLAYVARGSIGIHGTGSLTGGTFANSDGSASAAVAHERVSGSDAGGDPNAGEYGVYAGGDYAGGYFENTKHQSYAYIGNWDFGVEAWGHASGGYFKSSGGSGRANVGNYNSGITAEGNTYGGFFEDADGSGRAFAAYDRAAGTDAGGAANDGEYGVYALGSKAGGYFESYGDHWAYIATDLYGIKAYGDLAGGYFEEADGGSHVYVADNNGMGISAYGYYFGGYFEDSNGSGEAYLAYDRPSGTDKRGISNSGEYGVYAAGNKAGGYFEDANGTGHAYIGYADTGIWGWGTYAGGDFRDTDGDGWGRVGYGTYKIYGNGSVNFVQNHPYDPASVIVYASPEGDEVATYTRGTARLTDGAATVPLGETFQWVTNPDVGLTTFLTPVNAWCDLYVAGQATDEIVVRSRDGSDCDFNYMVYGLRIGFEEASVVQEKVEEAYIPSMSDHRELYQRRPDLRRFNSLERFETMRQAVGEKKVLDLSRAHALRDAIIEFDPAVHELSRPPGFDQRVSGDAEGLGEGHGGRAEDEERVLETRNGHDRRRAPSRAEPNPAIPVDEEGNVYAPSFRPSSGEVASLVEVSETVEAGDVLVIDRDSPGMMRRGFEGLDSGVIGVAAANPGVVLGSRPPALTDDEAGAGYALSAEVAMAGVVSCKVDADYGAIWPGDLLVTSPTPGHAMRVDSPLPGTIVGKALEPLEEGTGLIRVLVMLR